ncbi:hypothetical protein [Nostoc linckia]|uniref:hypothetical protein n=1 Tax=Nostoc linckia TaxID=92942 RepID=UPI00117C6731
MKGLWLVTVILIGSLGDANAQKGKVQTVVAASQNKVVTRTLPDLTFELIPVLVGAGNGVEKVEGIPGRINIPINFIVKNIGITTSKPTTVYAEYNFLGTQRVGTDMRESVIHVRSDVMPLQAIEPGKEVLRKQNFTFKTTPEQAYGKLLKLKLIIVVAGANNQNELLVSNNTSDELSVTIEK